MVYKKKLKTISEYSTINEQTKREIRRAIKALKEGLPHKGLNILEKLL